MDSREQMKDKILALALGEGLKTGITATFVAGASTFAASKYSTRFMQMMSLSAKTSLPVMAGSVLYIYSTTLILYMS